MLTRASIKESKIRVRLWFHLGKYQYSPKTQTSIASHRHPKLFLEPDLASKSLLNRKYKSRKLMKLLRRTIKRNCRKNFRKSILSSFRSLLCKFKFKDFKLRKNRSRSYWIATDRRLSTLRMKGTQCMPLT